MMSFMRTVIDVPDELIESLDQIGALEQVSRAALIRDAITEYLKVKSIPAAEEAFGLWKDRKTDGVRYQRSLRDEWERE
jgi:metal-responsive CopG/Arc/MetJ family transcriptional regulator